MASLNAADVFGNWHDRSGVRVAPRRLLAVDDDIHKEFFPEELMPHLRHDLVRAADCGVRRYLSAQHLYRYMNFTAAFETGVVNRATDRIAQARSGLDLSAAVRLDAYKIYVDESYHALYSFDVVQQVEARSGYPAPPYDFAPFLARLDEVGADFPQHRQLIQLLQVVVFETLITSLLARIPPDESVIAVVRDVVRDHAIDEGRHHAYFSALFGHLWGQLDHATRALVAPFLPQLIVRSLQPETEPILRELRRAGFSPDQARTIVRDSYREEAVAPGVRASASKTVALFECHGVLDLPGARDSFEAAGLVAAIPTGIETA